MHKANRLYKLTLTPLVGKYFDFPFRCVCHIIGLPGRYFQTTIVGLDPISPFTFRGLMGELNHSRVSHRSIIIGVSTNGWRVQS